MQLVLSLGFRPGDLTHLYLGLYLRGETSGDLTDPVFRDERLSLVRQMVGKIGGEAMSHLNSSSGSVEPALYYPGQKRPGEDGGESKENSFLTDEKYP